MVTMNNPANQGSLADRRDVEQFMHDEFFESLPSSYDRDDLVGAARATYVLHQTVAYEYAGPVSDLRQRLMVTPRARHGDQERIAHRFEVRSRGTKRVRRRSDRFGNSVLHVSVPNVGRSIEFRTRAVLVRDPKSAHTAPWSAAEPTCTPLTTPDDAISDAARALGPVRDVLETADAISDLVNSSFEYAKGATSVHTTAAEAWRLRRGVCQDMAHVSISMCASVGIASRYVSGHLVGDGASHAWIEVFDAQRQVVVAIDPTHRRRTDLRYLTTATGRDYGDVAPTRGTYTGRGSRGTLRVDKVVRLAEVA
jgi:transglutaminase-like putative cysteine protease